MKATIIETTVRAGEWDPCKGSREWSETRRGLLIEEDGQRVLLLQERHRGLNTHSYMEETRPGDEPSFFRVNGSSHGHIDLRQFRTVGSPDLSEEELRTIFERIRGARTWQTARTKANRIIFKQ